ncbi:hypothetical protein AUJ14_04210 [Candidatus Micrarchaeota archaeon CG1_02_55_22]|nr:MAG: hypothetical protein AUJ14_04210 [Candidatus Micrarchaeota archaeon CG1_02_55_22]
MDEEKADLSEIKRRIQAALKGGANLDERGELTYSAPGAPASGSAPVPVKDDLARLKTGIPGLDDLITGGIPNGSVVLLSGGPGCGKTILATQFLYNGAVKFDEPGLYISFEEEPESIIKAASLFGWDLAKLDTQNKLRIVFKDPYEIKDFAKSLAGELYYMIQELGAKRIVFDSITYYGLTVDNQFQLRKNIADLAKRLRKMGVTTLLISETPESQTEGARASVEQFVADGVIQLHNFLINETRQRAIEIVKLRKTNHDTFLHPYKITSKGIEVYPREQVFKD